MLKLWEWDSREHGWYKKDGKDVYGPVPRKGDVTPATHVLAKSSPEAFVRNLKEAEAHLARTIAISDTSQPR
jgi:hypothetical protein